MNKKSYRAKKADNGLDFKNHGRILPPMPPPRLPNRPSLQEMLKVRSQSQIAYTSLKYILAHIEKYPDWYDDTTLKEIKEGLNSCARLIGK